MPSINHPTTSRSTAPTWRHRAALLVGAAVLASLPACGHHGRDHVGYALVDNQTAATTSEDLLSFRMSRFRDPWTGNLLGGQLGPSTALNLGAFSEDYYDATGDLSGGGIIDWQDEYIGYERTTTFVVR